jgi:hypothetical protein
MPASVGYYLADITALKSIDASIRTDGYIRAVGTKRAWYIFFSSAFDSADDDNIVQPTSGTGRWFKLKALTLAGEIPDLSEFIDDRVNALIADSSHITTTYNDSSNTLTLSINSDSIGDTEVSSLSMSTISGLVSALSGKADTAHAHTSASISDFSEAVDDRVSALLQQGTGITLTYNDSSNTLTIAGSPVPTTFKNEGTTVGTAGTINVVGDLIDVTVGGGEATITVTTPSGSSIEVQDDTTTVGAADTLNFTGSGVNSITLSGSVATIDLSGGGSSSSGMSEINYTISSGTIAAGGSQTLTFSPELGIIVRKITSNFYARVRIYIDSTSASNDLARNVTTELSGEHGCLLEAVLVPSNLDLDLAPPVILYKKNSSTPLSVTIENLDSASRVFNIVLNSLKW